MVIILRRVLYESSFLVLLLIRRSFVVGGGGWFRYVSHLGFKIIRLRYGGNVEKYFTSKSL